MCAQGVNNLRMVGVNSQTHTLKDRVSLCSQKVGVAQGRSMLFEGGMAKVYAYRHI